MSEEVFEVQLPELSPQDIAGIDPVLWDVGLREIRMRLQVAKVIFGILRNEPDDPRTPEMWEKYKKEAAILKYVERWMVDRGEVEEQAGVDSPMIEAEAQDIQDGRPPDVVIGLKTLSLKAIRT